MDHRDQPRDPRGPPPEQRFGPPGGPRDPRSDRGPSGPPNDGRFSGPVHSPQQQWGPNQGGPPPRLPQSKRNNNYHLVTTNIIIIVTTTVLFMFHLDNLLCNHLSLLHCQ